MSEDQGRHAAADSEPGNRQDGLGDDVFARPAGAEDGFGEREAVRPYTPAPPTVSPQERAEFGRPAEGAAFAPTPGERLTPRPNFRPAVPNVLADAFSTTPDAHEGFAAAPGTRLAASGPRAESPWWKADATRDPWRDPSAPFWLGSGAVFTGDRPAQLDPTDDAETDEDLGPEDEPDDELPDNVRRGRFGLPSLAVVLVVGVIAGLIGGGVGWFATRETHSALHRPDVSIAQAETPTNRPAGSVAGVAKRVGPAVVSILVTTEAESAVGSGVVIDRDGDVLTNNHVIADAVGDKGASIKVTFSNEDTADAVVVGHDPTSDLAVIKVPNTQLTVATLGDSDKLAVGDAVIAIGSPLGLQGTVTEGIVSALNRPVHVSSEDGTSDAYLNAIQTDAAINPGNSGGALVNSSGAVIGINAAGRFTTPDGSTPVSGIGYAIPITYARTIALDLIHTGKASHAKLGAQGKTALTNTLAGAYLVQVTPGGSLAKAGLKPGDVIVAADGSAVQAFDQLVVIVQQHKPGDRIPITYYAAGKTRKTVTVTLS